LQWKHWQLIYNVGQPKPATEHPKATPQGDAITGSSGEDTLNGNDGSDALVDGSGNDNLNGGGGDDTLTGGPGEDEFDCGDGTDTVTDFNEAEGDTAEDNCENV
jgi:Ca2+-binding RTX toxin-like protein